MDNYATVNKKSKSLIEDYKNKEYNKDLKEMDQDKQTLLTKDEEYLQIHQVYDECLKYLQDENIPEGQFETADSIEPDYETIKDRHDESEKLGRDSQENFIEIDERENNFNCKHHEKENEFPTESQNKHDIEEVEHSNEHDSELEKYHVESKAVYKIENEMQSNVSISSVTSEPRSERLRKLSMQLPKIIITQSNTSLNVRRHDDVNLGNASLIKRNEEIIHNFRTKRLEELNINGKTKSASENNIHSKKPFYRTRPGYGDFPKRLVSKKGMENVALISNIPFEKIRLLNDTFHTLINLRWRWIVTGTIVVHFAIWLIFALFLYITALAHYDFEPNPPKRTCVTGGHDFLTIFLASVEAQTTIGFGDRAIDEECPESIFLFIMLLILGTGLSGVLTCVVYAKLTRPEKLSRDGVGFSKKAVISMRDGRLCLMMRAWDLNHDHIICSEFTAHFINTHRTKEGEVIRYYTQSLALQQRQFLLWPVTLVHVIDSTSPLYRFGPEHFSNNNYEITVSLKGASASMGTFTQSQTSYLPKEVAWGYRFPPVVKYDSRKQKYVIDQKNLDAIEPVDTPFCSAEEVLRTPDKPCLGASSSFSERISSFQLGRSSSFRKKTTGKGM